MKNSTVNLTTGLACFMVTLAPSAISSTISQDKQTIRVSNYIYNASGELVRRKVVSMQDHTAKVRSNPRRKAAMDRAAALIADRLTAQLGETIVSLRARHGLTQQELAISAGLQQSYLSRIENNKCSLHDETISKIANALNCSSDEVRSAFSNQWQYLESKKA